MPISFEDARSLILEHISPLGVEAVPLLEAHGRALAKDFIAPWGLPLFDNSAMDGFAVRSVDCAQQSTLQIVDYIPAGGTGDKTVTQGTASKIMTGAPIPPGCDAIVPFEEAIESKQTLTVNCHPVKGAHIRVSGEDVQAGDRVLHAGTLLRPSEISMLASLGQTVASVYRRPTVAILSTGDELAEPGQPLQPGQIVDSNSIALAAAVRELGAEPKILGIACDEAESLREKLQVGLESDMLITSAGVSMGDRDFVREVLAELGVKEHFWKIDIKPGRPTAFGLINGKPVFSVPGNPVSALITFEQFARPALLAMMGHLQVIRPVVKARLSEPVRKKAGRTQFMRVHVQAGEDGLRVSSSGDQNTGILNTLVRADGIALLPAERENLESGELVDVQLLGQIEGPIVQDPDRTPIKVDGNLESARRYSHFSNKSEKKNVDVKAISFVAKSGTGKTTLLEKVIAELKQQGLRVGAIKHDAHKFDIDHPGKDSHRFTAAGADTMLISSSAKLAVVKQHEASPPIEELLNTYFTDVDLVITEGFKKSGLPKIEVHRKQHNELLLCRGKVHDPSLLAVASDEPLEIDVPVLDLNQPEEVACFVMQALGLSVKPLEASCKAI